MYLFKQHHRCLGKQRKQHSERKLLKVSDLGKLALLLNVRIFWVTLTNSFRVSIFVLDMLLCLVHFEKCLSHIKENSWFVEQLGQRRAFFFSIWVQLLYNVENLLRFPNIICKAGCQEQLLKWDSSYPTWQANGLCEEPLDSVLCATLPFGSCFPFDRVWPLFTYFRFTASITGNEEKGFRC